MLPPISCDMLSMEERRSINNLKKKVKTIDITISGPTQVQIKTILVCVPVTDTFQDELACYSDTSVHAKSINCSQFT